MFTKTQKNDLKDMLFQGFSETVRQRRTNLRLLRADLWFSNFWDLGWYLRSYEEARSDKSRRNGKGGHVFSINRPLHRLLVHSWRKWTVSWANPVSVSDKITALIICFHGYHEDTTIH